MSASKQISIFSIFENLYKLDSNIKILEQKLKKYSSLCESISKYSSTLKGYNGKIRYENRISEENGVIHIVGEKWRVKVSSNLIEIPKGTALFLDDLLTAVEKVKEKVYTTGLVAEKKQEAVNELNNWFQTADQEDIKEFIDKVAPYIAWDEYSAAGGNYAGISDENKQWWWDEQLFAEIDEETGAILLSNKNADGQYVGMGWTSFAGLSEVANEYSTNIEWDWNNTDAALLVSVTTPIIAGTFGNLKSVSNVPNMGTVYDYSDTNLVKKIIVQEQGITTKFLKDGTKITTFPTGKVSVTKVDGTVEVLDKQVSPLSKDKYIISETDKSNNNSTENNNIVNQMSKSEKDSTSDTITSSNGQNSETKDTQKETSYVSTYEVSSEVKKEIGKYIMVSQNPASLDYEIKNAYNNLSQEAKDIIDGKVVILNSTLEVNELPITGATVPYDGPTTQNNNYSPTNSSIDENITIIDQNAESYNNVLAGYGSDYTVTSSESLDDVNGFVREDYENGSYVLRNPDNDIVSFKLSDGTEMAYSNTWLSDTSEIIGNGLQTGNLTNNDYKILGEVNRQMATDLSHRRSLIDFTIDKLNSDEPKG